MLDSNQPSLPRRDAWNKGRLIGQKRPLKPMACGRSGSGSKWSAEPHPQPSDFEEGLLVVRGYGHCRYLSSQMVAKS
jgi:hypothetical protein